jgi:hypothetical protein
MSLIEWSGERSRGRALLESLQAEIAPIAGSLETVPFLRIQTLTDEIFAAGKRTYIKAGFPHKPERRAITVDESENCMQ